jgi:hypothetical protein
MNKKIIALISVLVLLAFIVYMIIDLVKPEGSDGTNSTITVFDTIPDSWKISSEFKVTEGNLESVAVSNSGLVFLGGKSFISCYDKELKKIWSFKTDSSIASLNYYNDTLYATSSDNIFVISKKGEIIEEWGPFEKNSIFTSVSVNANFVAVADAGNKEVYILNKKGAVLRIIGQNDGQFVIPSPYFEVALDEKNNVYIANTGHRRIETHSIDGSLLSSFGEPGLAPDAFAGCCAPAHFILVPQGFVTAEKGVNRIKILNKEGRFVEFVSAKNNFVKSVPLDLASADGIIIYGAYPEESKLLIFTRK